jgi:uncharacterized protein
MVPTEQIGTVSECWRYPVKSFKGMRVDQIEVRSDRVAGDRAHAVFDTESGTVLSAKRVSRLLEAYADDASVRLPDGVVVSFGAPEMDEVLSSWLGRDVTLLEADESDSMSYEMTFDPPDDSAEYVEIPLPDGSFVDLSPLHVVAQATLEACRASRSELDWDVRRFRPNLVIDSPGDAFVEDSWVPHRLQLGATCVLRVLQPTVRCAMPLRAQPAGPGDGPALARQPELFAAMNDLHEASPNHLGIYAEVDVPGVVSVGDPVTLVVD